MGDAENQQQRPEAPPQQQPAMEQSAAIQTMIDVLRDQETEEGRMKGYHFKPRSEDVMVVSPAKCGTTWLCQIVQSLRSRGDMDFEEINLEMPCVEMWHEYGLAGLEEPQRWQPCVFKTHFWHPDCPKGAGKYLYIVRDPMESGPSFYHFMNGWAFDADSISLDAFIREFFMWRGDAASPLQNAGQWSNMASWYPRRGNDDVLWLHYEDLHADRHAAVRLIADFLGIGVDDAELQAIAVEQSSIEFMKAHPTKYDEHMLKAAVNGRSGRPADAGMGSGGKVREGRLGANKQQLTPELEAALQQRWTEYMLPRTGYGSYADMRRGINSELGRPFAS
ncbi:sulfotransferase [Micractinium conductrix]|uniref:Sulfotransferase n=1 Tax=Micractinium conductrix TaxID=554055 RepID=A0A2P6VC12_9CHLO|nr:sulfotransferase [Micractinium conductrix]|eukprot:PSC71632.1 sulfotransferase [Micractinium conductrix]